MSYEDQHIVFMDVLIIQNITHWQGCVLSSAFKSERKIKSIYFMKPYKKKTIEIHPFNNTEKTL